MSEKTTRRRYVLALGAVGLAGCAEFEVSSDGGDESDDDETESTEAGTDDGSESTSVEAEATLRQYLEAFGEDESTLESLTHPESPLSTEVGEITLTVREIAPRTLSERAETLDTDLTAEEVTDARDALETTVEGIGAEEYVTLRFAIETDSGERDSSVALLVRADGQWYVYLLSVDSYLYDADHEGTEDTDSGDSDQTANRVQVVSTVGVDISDGRIGRVEIVVKQAPGADDIDLSTTTMQFIHSSGSTDLTFGSTGGSGSADTFGVETIQDEGETSLDGPRPTLDDPADRAVLVVDTSAGAVTDGSFGEGGTATVRLNTQSGGSTELRLVVPETLSGSDAVAL